MIGVSRNPSEKSKHTATLWGRYVREQARGSGRSGSLTEATPGATTAVKVLKLSVLTTHTATYSLYRADRFNEWAIDKYALCIDDAFYDEDLMRKDLIRGPR